VASLIITTVRRRDFDFLDITRSRVAGSGSASAQRKSRETKIRHKAAVWNPMEKAFSGEDKAFQKPKNDFPWGINKRGNVLTVARYRRVAAYFFFGFFFSFFGLSPRPMAQVCHQFSGGRSFSNFNGFAPDLFAATLSSHACLRRFFSPGLT
jgi:hypothetical protein